MTSVYPTHTVELALGDPTVTYYDLTLIYGAAVYYRLNETSGTSAADSSGNSRTGTFSGGGFTYSQTGALSGDPDTAIGWDGTNSAKLQLNSLALSPTNAFTVEAWCKRVHTSRTDTIFDINDGTTVFRLDYDSVTNKLRLRQSTPGSTTHSSTFTVTDTNWHHVAATSAGDVYFDGALAIGGAFLSSFSPVAVVVGALSLGGGGVGSEFEGLIDEFAVYNSILTGDQITAHYQSAAIANPIVWTDVSTYFIGGSTQRGRQNELDTVEAGVGSARLNNNSRRFDPVNAAGAYYPNLKPLRRIRKKWTFGASTYTRHVGFIERYDLSRQGPRQAWADLRLVDGFESLAQTDVSASVWAQELAGARIGHVLDACLWPRSLRSIDSGSATIPSTAASDVTGSGLAHIQDVAASDLGYFFVSAAGLATFHDRTHRATISASTASQATFADDGTGLPYQDVVFSYAKDTILNDVTTTALPSGSAQNAVDLTSITSYFRRSSVRTILGISNADALSQSTALVGRYKQPQLRITQMTLKPHSGTTGASLWAQILGREIGDRITVKSTPPGGGAQIVIDCWIEAMADSYPRSMDWTSVWTLSPVT